MRLITQNLITFVESKEYTDRAFEAEVGWSNGFYGKVKAGKIAFSIEKLRSIIDRYPDLNIHWLCTGEGEMLLSDVHLKRHDALKEESLLTAIHHEMEKLSDHERMNIHQSLEGILNLLRSLNN